MEEAGACAAAAAEVNGRKVALITGITGQDGSYLAEFLLEKGYEVHGIVRRSSSFNTGRIEHLYKNPQAHIEGNMKLHYGDLTDSTCLVKIINEVKPTEIYNLGAQSHVKLYQASLAADLSFESVVRAIGGAIWCQRREPHLSQDEVHYSRIPVDHQCRGVAQKRKSPSRQKLLRFSTGVGTRGDCCFSPFYGL